MKTRLAFGSLIGGLLVVTMVAASVAGQTTKAPRLSDKELVALVQNAKTAADHEKLAAYYDATATELEQKATKHKEARRSLPAHAAPAVLQRQDV